MSPVTQVPKMYKTFAIVFVFVQAIYSFEIQQSCKDLYDHRNCKKLPDLGECGGYPVSLSPRILGGETASPDQVPWMALVPLIEFCGEDFHTSSCGGTIISKTHVLTAAHCVPVEDCFCNNCTLSHGIVGEHTQSKIDCDDEGRCLTVMDYTIHEYFIRSSLTNDIAIIRLDDPIDFNTNTAPICLPMASLFQSDTTFGQRTTFDAAGWGIYGLDQITPSDTLRVATLPYVDNSRCILVFRKSVTDEQMCAGGNGINNVCLGDSGGPLMKAYSVEQSPERYYLFGIASTGPGVCSTPYPTTFAKVTAYLPWILDHMD